MEALKAARQLRASGRIRESYELVRSSGAVPAQLVWQHQPCFWDEHAAGNCVLTRRTGTDAAFVRALWSDTDFLRRFHRGAGGLPQNAEDLERILNSEYAALLSDLGSIHWLVRDAQRRPWGMLSLVNASLQHRRAEVLLGVKAGAPFGLATAAMLLLFRFYFGALKFHKLCSLTFDDNPRARRATLHLGFTVEGRLREHFYDRATQRFVDMVQAGLLEEDAFNENNKGLMRRLGIKGTLRGDI